MAFSTSLAKAQIPIGCQLCETGTRINWRCIKCNYLICENCNKLHLKITKDHKIININEIEVTDFKVVKQYTVDTKNINVLHSPGDGSLWISDFHSKKLLHVNLFSDDINMISSYSLVAKAVITTSTSDSIFIIEPNTSTVKVINDSNLNFEHSKLDIRPLIANCVHSTRDGYFIVTGRDATKGIGVLVVMDQNGKNVVQYDTLRGKPIFTCPTLLKTSKDGNIFVLDEGRKTSVVVINTIGDISYYYGNHEINSVDKPFKPKNILVTPRDNVLVLDFNTDCLHILNNNGEFMSCYNLKDILSKKPYSLALSVSGTIYVGSVNRSNAPPDSKSVLYELEYFGV